MGNYTVSARKYRPVTFESVVGQEALTTTLKNAISSGKLASAYLFCGPRGVGKTTCARLFAKTINCEHPGPDGEACGTCASCQTFNEDMRSYNVFELDAASNNSVDDIRALTEQVRIPPINGKYKVYIIDEVHMLSTAAFNAFLKTLEEPPAYAIFILATTEKHKVIPTILSRCQTYDFSRITNQDIVNHLKRVAEKEGVEYQEEALNVIAEKADGGMRDALSIFDQVVSFTQGHLTYAKTVENLNVIEYDNYFRMTDLMLEGKVSETLLLLNDIICKGFDPSHMVSGLLLHMRNLLVSRDACTLPLLEVSTEIRARYQQQAAKCQPKFLYRAMKLCTDCDLNYRVSKNKRLLVELTLIRITQAAAGEDDDDSSGRRPKTLKPIFSKLPAQSQTAGTGSSTAAAKTSVKKADAPAKKTDAPAAKAQADAPTAAKPATTAIPPREIPRIGAGNLFTSIHGRGNAPKADAPAAAQASVSKSTFTKKDQPLTAERLVHWWKEYATQLPDSETPLRNRMLVRAPELLSESSFRIVASNELAGQDFKANVDKIQKWLREKCSNQAITMQVDVDTTTLNARILSKHEQLAVMEKSNPLLAQLEKALSLEIE